MNSRVERRESRIEVEKAKPPHGCARDVDSPEFPKIPHSRLSSQCKAGRIREIRRRGCREWGSGRRGSCSTALEGTTRRSIARVRAICTIKATRSENGRNMRWRQWLCAEPAAGFHVLALLN